MEWWNETVNVLTVIVCAIQSRLNYLVCLWGTYLTAEAA